MAETQSQVLVIDDDQDMRWALRTILGESGLGVIEAESGTVGLEAAMRCSPSAVLLDMRMPGIDGAEVLAQLKRKFLTTPVIVITGHGSVSGAVDAIRAGAFDYLTKPFDNDVVVSVVRRAIAQSGTLVPPSGSSLRATITGMMGRSREIETLIAQIEGVIDTDYSVLISGETGTGKEIVAQALHRHGRRSDRPFVVFDCGAIVENLVEAEFFGHERGAFTGAVERRRGRFEIAAAGGAIFLDEIGNLCAVGQQALLRALEERVIFRVGGSAPIRLDTRVIAATNERLGEDDDLRAFRPDLFYRLSEYCITLPPLRARPDDIEFLARRFLTETQRVVGTPDLEITSTALDLLRSHDWPGNVRQLRNVVRRAALMAGHVVTTDQVEACMLRPARRRDAGTPTAALIEAPLRDLVRGRIKQVERDAILGALAQTGGNKTTAARALGIDYKTFRVKLKIIQQEAPPPQYLAEA